MVARHHASFATSPRTKFRSRCISAIATIGRLKKEPKLRGKYLAIRDVVRLNKKAKEQQTKGKKEEMKLEINVPVSGLDLASLLDGEQGLFLCQNRGQNYITVAKAGHSIAFGPMPIGKPIQEQVAAIVGPEPWFATKISNATELAEFRGSLLGREIR
jgi:hypothetical protein